MHENMIEERVKDRMRELLIRLYEHQENVKVVDIKITKKEEPA